MTAIKYPHDTSWTVERNGEEVEVLVEYGVEEYATPASGHYNCPPENYDPGSGWVFYINPMAFVSEADSVTLSELEIDAVHSWLEENHEEDDGYYEDY